MFVGKIGTQNYVHRIITTKKGIQTWEGKLQNRGVFGDVGLGVGLELGRVGKKKKQDVEKLLP